MQSGKLRHKVNIQTASESLDTSGTPTYTWGTLYTAWMEITPLQGRELFNVKQILPEVTLQGRMRYRSGITTSARISFGSKIYGIDGIVNTEEKNKELILYLKELG